MAHIVPEGWRQLSGPQAAGLGWQRELETLALLAESLPDTYTVYHGVHWTRVRQGHALFGEIDFAVVNPAGRVLLIEQKSGFLEETGDGLAKRYGSEKKLVAVQLARNLEHFRARLAQHLNGEKMVLDALFYCPDYAVKQPGAAGIAPERVVDAGRREHLPQLIQSILPSDEAATPTAQRVHRFLANLLELTPDVSAMIGQAQAMSTRLAGGLAEWARKIECRPFRLRVVGTAGSGKTQLALAALGDAVAAGRRPLYVCYNRPLADHVARIAPAGSVVATYHQLCDRIARHRGQVPDFRQPGAFQALEAGFASYVPDAAWGFDELIVDEGQDFQPDWIAPLLGLLREDGRAWWLEDPMQNLYRRPRAELPGWVTLRSDTNYRSPRDVLERLNRILARAVPIESGSPLAGAELDILTYADAAGLIEQTKSAVTRGLGAGFRKDMMAVVSYRGREHSLLTPYTQLGPHRLKAFTGQYDLFGDPVYSEGELFIDSVHRFKGQAAPCVIFTEIDFEELDQAALGKLFVGMTRAMMKLVLVISERAARQLLERVEGDGGEAASG